MADKHGRYYWCVKTPLSGDGEIYLHADEVEISEGVAVFWRCKDGERQFINLALAPGQWTGIFAASLLDGSAVAVEHWKGEVLR